MGVAVYNDADFKAAFPAFAATPSGQLLAKFGLAGLYLDNTDCSPVRDVAARTQLLYMITAHLAQLDPTIGKQETVGRISNAAEGSVSVATDYVTQSQSQAFWVQTQYGAMFWAATARFRSARYVPAPRRRLGVPGVPGGWLR
jgi:hypothetical protein